MKVASQMSASSRAAGAAARIARYYDERLAAHGDTPAGAAWPNAEDLRTRLDVVLDIAATLAGRPDYALCDLACGTGALLARINEQHLPIAYTGIDISERALEFARKKFPGQQFFRLDVLAAAEADLEVLRCDVLAANGLFTVKADVPDDQMWEFMTATLVRVWPFVRRGVILNVMSERTDAARTDLFRVPPGELRRFLQSLGAGSVGIRDDYGLYDCMAYAAKPG